MINIYAQNGNYLVWNADNVMELRSKHRIIGSLIGCVPRHAFQSSSQWLPLQLSPEEARLLHEKGIAKIVLNTSLSHKPSPESVEEYWKNRKEKCDDQIKYHQENQEKFISERAEAFVQGKFKSSKKSKKHKKNVKNLVKKAEMQTKESEAQAVEDEESHDKTGTVEYSNGESSPFTESSPQKYDDECAPSTSEQEQGTEKSENVCNPTTPCKKQRTDVSETSLPSTAKNEQSDTLERSFVVTPSSCEQRAGMSESSFNNGIEKSEENEVEQLKKAFIEKETARCQPMKENNCMVQLFTESIWKKPEENIPVAMNFPQTDEEELRYAVFKDLWEKGLYITSGLKFGGDYLAYAGDPVRCHALYTVYCISQKHTFRAKQVINFGRVGHQVKKTFVLASLTASGCVKYLSINWASHLTSSRKKTNHSPAATASP